MSTQRKSHQQPTNPQRRFIVIAQDGRTMAQLSDVIEVAAYLTTYSRDVNVNAQHLTGQDVWHGTRERNREQMTDTQILSHLKNRIDGLIRAGCNDPRLQRWHPQTGACNLDRFGAPNNPPKKWSIDT